MTHEHTPKCAKEMNERGRCSCGLGDLGPRRGRTQLALENAVDAALEGRTVWFVSQDEENSRSCMARAFEIVRAKIKRSPAMNTNRREIDLFVGRIRFVQLLAEARGFVRPSLTSSLNSDHRFCGLNPRETETGRIILDHHAAYLLDRDERRRQGEDKSAALIMGGEQ